MFKIPVHNIQEMFLEIFRKATLPTARNPPHHAVSLRCFVGSALAPSACSAVWSGWGMFEGVGVALVLCQCFHVYTEAYQPMYPC